MTQIQIQIQTFYDYSGVKVKVSNLPNEVNGYVEFILKKLYDTNTIDNAGSAIIAEHRETINLHRCDDLLNNYTKSTEITEQCIYAYGKMYAESMYMGALAGWETPVGCCKVIVINEDGSTLGTYQE